MKVTVQGPNLSVEAARKGELHVHTADCQDNQKYGPRKPRGGDGGWTIEAGSRQEIVLAVYDPSDFNYDPSEWRGYDDLWVAPCIKGLPDETAKEAWDAAVTS